MIDRDRILSRLDQLEGYLRELRGIVPAGLDGYGRPETRRACERLLQVSIEAAIDTCGLLVTGLRLGVPGEEDDLFDKLAAASVLPAETVDRLRGMKRMRNVLVHEYARIDDRLVLHTLHHDLGDLDEFIRHVTLWLRERDS